MVYFKHWSRKGYAVFQSLGKQIKICALLIGILGSFSQRLAAQTTPEQLENKTKVGDEYAEEEIQLNEVVVQTQRVATVYSEQARVVQVITKAQLQQAPVQSIQDLLEFVAGVDVQQRGPMGIQADIRIRGGSFDQALVLLNGVNINNPQTGHLNLNLPIDMEAVESIEVLQGPGSRIFGPNAFSGAINIITNTSKKDNLSVHVMAGQYGTAKSSVSGTFNTGKLTNFVSTSVSGSDGFAHNTDFNQKSIYYRGNLTTNAGDLDVQLGYGDKAFGASTFYSANYPDQFEENSSLYTSVKFTSNTAIKFTPLIYWNRSQDRFELFRDFKNAADWYTDHNYHMTDVYGANLSAEYASSIGVTAFGVDFRSENILSNNLGFDMDEEKEVPGEDAYFNKSVSRNNISAYLEHNIYINQFTISAGMMANWSSKYEADPHTFNWFPGVDLSYKFGNGLSIFSSFNTAMRLPTFTDMFYSSPTDLGDPDLEAEESYTFEGGLKFGNSALNASLSAFRRNGRNIIDWVRASDDEPFQVQNIESLETVGVDAFVQYLPQVTFGKSMPIRKISLSYSYLDARQNDNPAEISKYALSNLKHKLSMGIDHNIYKNIYANWQIRYQDRAYSTWELGDGNVSTENPFEPFWLVDARIYYQKKAYMVYVEASNLFDRDYIDFVAVEQPGRWVKAGVRINLDL
ncbi:TonB-dependent receptor [Persicobacter diffluens]|uniref:Vitamin B12 transporter BtuB n=1 Tax=Persicobacter diffluens TaxID=981 RepID=A0AAN4W1B6_9BACT|nr:vitamin B12 transporter BtuB [Persicobacter diffluens]